MQRAYDIMNGQPCRKAFTLVELMVIIAIVVILASMLFSAIHVARESARTTYCMNNLRQMGQAMVMYELTEKSLPLGDLPKALKPYDGNPQLYICPEDPDQTSNSYAPYYVYRAVQEATTVLASCHRHHGGTRGPTLYGSATVRVNEIQEVRDRSGSRVAFGAELRTEEVEFADGSTAKVTGSGAMEVLTSFRDSDDEYYHIIKIKRDHLTQVFCTVTPGSAYDVVTPAAVASALGTRYRVTTSTPAGQYRSSLHVNEGTVAFRARAPKSMKYRVKAGQSGSLSLPRDKCPQDE